MKGRFLIVGFCALGVIAAGSAHAQGVRMDPRGGVRFGSPSAGARSAGDHLAFPTASFERGTVGSLGHIPGYVGGHHAGFAAHGEFEDGDFSLRFHLGGGLPLHSDSLIFPYHSGLRLIYRSHWYYPADYGYPRGYSYGLPLYGYPLYGRYVDQFGAYPVDYRTTYVDPRMTPQQGSPMPAIDAMEPATPAEWGRWFLARGDNAQAIARLSEAISADDADAGSQRALALALLREGRLAEGVAMMRSAYENDPSLARDPISADALGQRGERELALLVRRVALYANRVDSASAWLSEAVLMQAQGRDAHARRMIERALESGLDPAIARGFGVEAGG